MDDDKYVSDEEEIDEDNESDNDNVLSISKAKINPLKSKKIAADEDDEEVDDEDEDKNDEEEELDEELDEGDDDSENDNEPTNIFTKANDNARNVGNLYPISDDDTENDDEEEEDENYLQKFDENIKQNIIADHHPELNFHNYEEIESLTTVIRNENGKIIDPFHKTLPFLTKYEKSRILGERAHQLNAGATSFVEVDANIIDGYLIALKELEQKKIPFIVKRPLPNGGCEYWKLKDLELLI
jgi:DNA-directed RNA polymerase I, II, and III subunit RPABC2